MPPDIRRVTDFTLADVWPFANFEIVYPNRLRLRPITNGDAVMLARIRESGVVREGEEDFQPDLLTFLPSTAEERAVEFLQTHWANLASCTKDKWKIDFGVWAPQPTTPPSLPHPWTLVGCQSLAGKNFHFNRQVHTGSWLGLPYQGKGYGTLMRAGVLEYAFSFLFAEEALTGHHTLNVASRRVSEKLGYVPIGQQAMFVNDGLRCITEHKMLLTASRWRATRPEWSDSFTFAGAEPVTRFLI